MTTYVNFDYRTAILSCNLKKNNEVILYYRYGRILIIWF